MRAARQALRAWKHRAHRSQQEIACTLGISEPYLSQIMHGLRTPSLTLMIKIEDLTGIPLRAWAPVNIIPADGRHDANPQELANS